VAVTARSSRCKACEARTTASGGYCQRCKSLRHHGYKRIKDEHLILDQAGGSWWIWDPRGTVLVSGKPTAAEAVIALGTGDVEDTIEAAHATKKTPAQLEVQQLRKDARLWWQIARAESRARFRGSYDAMDRAIAIEKKLVALGVTPPRRPKGFEE
jgi:hypothetical protein